MLLPCNDIQVTYYELWVILCLDSASNYWISDYTTNYQLSNNGAHSRKYVCLHEVFHEENYLPLEKSYIDG